jgi:hypothetical protein
MLFLENWKKVFRPPITDRAPVPFRSQPLPFSPLVLTTVLLSALVLAAYKARARLPPPRYHSLLRSRSSAVDALPCHRWTPLGASVLSNKANRTTSMRGTSCTEPQPRSLATEAGQSRFPRCRLPPWALTPPAASRQPTTKPSHHKLQRAPVNLSSPKKPANNLLSATSPELQCLPNSPPALATPVRPPPPSYNTHFLA